MRLCVGIPPSPRYGAALASVGAAGLVSANALYRRGKFRPLAPGAFGGLVDVRLDSAGWNAMKLFGEYPWTDEAYVALAGALPWRWWAAPDYCCEPDIAGDHAAVLERVARTVAKLRRCRELAADQGIPAPMPVLQGWRPAEYQRCADLMGELPELVGIGSMCRRQVRGPAGLLEILGCLSAWLPPHVRFHLFGIKGSAIPMLLGHPRVASVDTFAWDYNNRRNHEGSRPVAARVDHMMRWYARQTAQRNLFGSVG